METALLVTGIVLTLAVIAAGGFIGFTSLYCASQMKVMLTRLPEFQEETEEFSKAVSKSVREFSDELSKRTSELREALAANVRTLEQVGPPVKDLRGFADGLPRVALIMIKAVENLRVTIETFQKSILASQPRARRDAETFQPPSAEAEAQLDKGSDQMGDLIRQAEDIVNEIPGSVRTEV